MDSRLKLTLVGLVTAMMIVVAFFAGYASFSLAHASAASERFPLLAQAEDDIARYFVKAPPSSTQLEYGAIRGMLAALNDKFSFFIEPPVAQSESNVLAGQYGGIGVQVKRDDTGQFVLYPFPNNPAAKAGVQNGDMLVSVNGKEVPVTAQPDAVDQLLRGEVKPGSAVTFVVHRPSTNANVTYTVEFGVIDVPSVLWRVLSEDQTLGYIQIINFTSRTPDEMKAAIDGLTAKNVKGLVLDVRNNPGGLLDESVKTAGYFLDGGPVVIEEMRTSETVDNAPTGQATALPLVVLINGNTASAAELVSAALQDRGRALLIGQQTYGKGSVQLILDLSDKSSMHLTTAEWLTPKRNTLSGKGLTPDVPITSDPTGRDLELTAAIQQLQKTVAAPVTATPGP
ncbi:MAG: S41 family peptidase [Aggregatilineales bacterium]